MDDPLRQYKAFVDALTPLRELYFKVEHLAGLDGLEGEVAKLLLAKLNEEERGKGDKLFQPITGTGLYQVLERLDQWMAEGRLTLAWQGVELPTERFGEDLACDWLRRCEGEPWPDESTCPVHHELLKVERVPITYGLLRHPVEYYQARRDLFPLANAVVEGGCFVGSQETEVTPYCESCRKALVEWALQTGLHAGLPSGWKSFVVRYGGQA